MTAKTSPTKPSTRVRTRAQHPMMEDLGSHTIASVATNAHTLWVKMNLYPGDTAEILALVDQISAWATNHDITTLADLTGTTAERMFCDIAGVKALDARHNRDQLNALHRLRNALSALRGAVLIADKNLKRRRSDRPGDDSLSAGMPALPSRTGVARRPLCDDEILLTRTLVEIDLREEGQPLPLNAYLLAETGLMGMESTKVMTADLDDRHEPKTVDGSGVWGFGARTLPLEPFVANAMSRTLLSLREGTQPLSYGGNTPGTKAAAASLTPVIGRFLSRAGIDDPSVTSKSLSLWRAHHVLRTTENFKAAKKIHGGRARNLLVDFKCTVDETQLHKKRVVIRDHEDKKVATVRAKHVNDCH